MEKGLEKLVDSPQIELPKNFFVDTSSLITQPAAPHILANNWSVVSGTEEGEEIIAQERRKKGTLKDTPNNVYICSLLTHELDNVMHDPKKAEIKWLAGRARNVLRDIRDRGQIAVDRHTSYVELEENGSRIYFVEHDEEEFLRKPRFAPNIDDRLVWNFQKLMLKDMGVGDRQSGVIQWIANKWKAYFGPASESHMKWQFVSQDVILRDKVRDKIATSLVGHPEQKKITAECQGELEAANATNDPHQLYKGLTRATISAEEYSRFVSGTPIDMTDSDTRPEALKPVTLKHNQFLELKCNDKVENRILKGKFKRDNDSDNDEHQLVSLEATRLDNYQWFTEAVARHKPDRTHRIKDEIEVPDDVSKEMIENMIRASSMKPEQQEGLLSMATSKKNRGNVAAAYRDVAWSLQNYRIKHEGRSKLWLPFNDEIVPNHEQIRALELLCDPETNVVSIIGEPGTGKTLLAVLAGLTQINEGRYSHIVYYRPPIGMNKGHGFMPGNLRQKLAPWTVGFANSAITCFGGYNGDPTMLSRAEDELARLESEKLIVFDQDTTQQGATWHKQYVIIDEAELETLKQMRTLISRGMDDCKIVLVGDPIQTESTESVAHWLTRRNNGLTHAVDKLSGKKRYGTITFTDPRTVMRGETAELARYLG